MVKRYEKMNPTERARVRILKEMDAYIIGLGDEDTYEWWITGPVPDEPCDEDFETIATDDKLWMRAIRWFYLTVKDTIED